MGELVQGLRRGKEVLVSLTIDRFSEMEVTFRPPVAGGEELWKSKRALEIALKEWGREDLEGRISFYRRKSLPPGKGFASSTADIAALLGALAALLGRSIREEEIARIALQVEPSDGTFFSPLCLFDHLQGEVVIRLPLPKYLGIVVVELPGETETVKVDRERLHRNWERFAREIEEAFTLLERGLEERDLRLVGKAATMSSSIMQEVEPERVFVVLREHLCELGALGINRAHTGRALGILFDWRVIHPEEMKKRVEACLGNNPVKLWIVRAISGGVRVMRT